VDVLPRANPPIVPRLDDPLPLEDLEMDPELVAELLVPVRVGDEDLDHG
jgi:hypothetical protein